MLKVSLGFGVWVAVGSAIASVSLPFVVGASVAAPSSHNVYATSTVGERRDYIEVPLSQLKGSVFGGDPAQLPILALTSTPGVPQNLQPKVQLERPQPDKIMAWVTYLGLEDDSLNGIRYRVDMESTGSQCSCQGWRVVWVGQQYKCQAGRGSQDWSTQLCL